MIIMLYRCPLLCSHCWRPFPLFCSLWLLLPLLPPVVESPPTLCPSWPPMSFLPVSAPSSPVPFPPALPISLVLNVISSTSPAPVWRPRLHLRPSWSPPLPRAVVWVENVVSHKWSSAGHQYTVFDGLCAAKYYELNNCCVNIIVLLMCRIKLKLGGGGGGGKSSLLFQTRRRMKNCHPTIINWPTSNRQSSSSSSSAMEDVDSVTHTVPVYSTRGENFKMQIFFLATKQLKSRLSMIILRNGILLALWQSII